MLDGILKCVPFAIRKRAYGLPLVENAMRWALNHIVGRDWERPVTITAGYLKGLRINMRGSFMKAFWLGTYEEHLQRIFVDRVKEGMVVLDCGAYIGFFTLLFAKLVGRNGKVFAFDPDPETRVALQKNIDLNRFNDRVTISEYALSDRTGEVTFIAEGKSVSRLTGLGRREDKGPVIRVQSITLDEFCEKHGVRADLIKMDIEGAEGIALEGARKTLAEVHPLVVCEIHTECAAKTVYSVLREAGYDNLYLVKERTMKEWRPEKISNYTYHIFAEW